MNEPLHLKYRPSEFSQMVGQRLTAVVLDKMVANAKVPSGLLFAGPSGTGKTTAARILARALNPGIADAYANGSMSGGGVSVPGVTYSDISTIEIDAASNGGVADVRALTESLRYSIGSQYRVVILDEAQSMTREAFNALLKTLEEPPAGTIFVLVTTEVHKIPETVASRLMEFEFRRVAPADILDRLVTVSIAESISISMEALDRISHDADGSVRTALMALEKANLAGLHTLAEYLAATSVKDVSSRLLLSLAHGDVDTGFRIADIALGFVGHPAVLSDQVNHCLRDLLVLYGGGQVRATGAALEERHTLVSLLGSERIFAAMQIIWDLKTRVRVSDDPRGSLDLALALICSVFTRNRQVIAPTPPVVQPPPVIPPTPVVAEPRRLNLAEMHL